MQYNFDIPDLYKSGQSGNTDIYFITTVDTVIQAPLIFSTSIIRTVHIPIVFTQKFHPLFLILFLKNGANGLKFHSNFKTKLP